MALDHTIERYLPIAVFGLVIGLLAFPTSAALNAYVAETVDPAKKQGTVQVGNLKWQCQGTRCTISGPWPKPAVGACKDLARQVGEIKSYGHANKQLTPAELKRCNAGLAGSSQRTPSKQTPAAGTGTTSPIGPPSRNQPIKSPVPTTGGKPAETVEPGETRAGTRTPGARSSVRAEHASQWKPVLTSVRPAQGSVIYQVANNDTSIIVIRGRDLMPTHTEMVTRGTVLQPETKKLRVRQINNDNWTVFTGSFGDKTIEKWHTLSSAGRYSLEPLSWTDTEIRARLRANEATDYTLTIHEMDEHGRIGVARGNTVRFRAEASDKDGDGHLSVGAGGDDCDDNDRNRYYGNLEVADFDGHDEDCDPNTIGNLDRDGDGYIDYRVFNWTNHIDVNVGEDCDDGRTNVNPRSVDVCNNRDDNCDGRVDEELLGCPTANGVAPALAGRPTRYRPTATTPGTNPPGKRAQ